jgi:CPA2 family monovalent cation:H+ antiporter-2
MSMALGALIAGLLLAGTEYRRQVEVTIDPFKTLLVGIFLISAGMSLDWHLIMVDFPRVAAVAIGMVAAKAGLVMLAARGFGLSWTQGLQTGLLLGPGGEFGFVIGALATAEHVLEPADAQLITLVLALTMAAIPFLSMLGTRIGAPPRDAPAVDPDLLPPAAVDDRPRVIIAGFGRVGQMVASLLDRPNIPHVAIDHDPDRVARARRNNRNVHYGDLTQVEMLRLLGIQTALALVVTVDAPDVAAAMVATARGEREDLRIVARARDARHAASLYHAGATDAVPETIEASLQLSEAVLVELGVPMGPIIVSIHEKRAELQEGIKTLVPTARVRTLGAHRLRDMLS